MKPCVMQLVVSLRPGGAERLALNILSRGKERFRGLLAGLLHEPGELEPQAELAEIPCTALRAEKTGRVMAVWNLYNLLRREGVTLLHAQAAYLLPYALPAAKMAGIPLVYTEHALRTLQTRPRVRVFAKICAPMLAGITTVIPEVAEYFITRLNIAESRLRVIPNGVDLQRFTPFGPKAELPWNGGDEVVFGTVARLCEAKDHATLLEAFALLRHEYAKARLLIVGDGEKRRELESMILALNLEDSAHITGMRADIPELLRAMDFFVLSSIREGFPMAVLEAMACGLPVVSTTVGGIPAMKARGVTMVSPGDHQALAESMAARMVEQNSGAGPENRRFVESSFHNERMVESYFNLYREAGGLP